jgi:uncharacterized protein DUF4326
MPERIQRRRTRGWRMPEGAVYVGRPSRWGNPYRWSAYPSISHDFEGEPYAISASARRGFAVTDFRSAVQYGIGSIDYPSREEIRRELAGRDLVCWCPKGQPCHADVLLELANGDPHA